MVGEYMFPLQNPGATVGSIPQAPSDPKDVVKEHTVTPVTAAGCTAGPLIPSWYAAWGQMEGVLKHLAGCCALQKSYWKKML